MVNDIPLQVNKGLQRAKKISKQLIANKNKLKKHFKKSKTKRKMIFEYPKSNLHPEIGIED